MTTTVYTVTKADWVDLGSGPSIIECLSGGEIYVKEAASKPAASDKGHLLKGYSLPDSNREFNTSQKLWARALRETVDVAVTHALDFIQGLSIPNHDYISLSYSGSNVVGVVYKTGGSGGTTVATLTLAYDGSGNLTSVART